MIRYLNYATTVAVAAALLARPGSAISQEADVKPAQPASTETPAKTVEIDVAGSLEQQAGMYGGEMIAEKMPVAGVHASTIAEIEGGIVTAWFGGAEEGAYDVVIWISRNEGGGWSAPKPAADGVDTARRIQYPCWNPVLFRQSSGTLLLFYKVGPNPRQWWGMMKKSKDDGLSWDEPVRLPKGYIGPVKNKPIELANGILLCGSSLEDAGWRVQMERYVQNRYWNKTKPLNSPLDFAAIQPTLLAYPDGSIQALCRTKSGRLTDCWSSDNGQKWTRMKRTQLPNPNAGVDGTVLADGRALLVYNHTRRGRSPLNVSVSKDGKTWEAALVLENQPGEYSYPAVIQTSDSNVHVTYTHNRTNIKHVVIDPAKLAMQPIVEGQWPQ